jgi:hypothetical protein
MSIIPAKDETLRITSGQPFFMPGSVERDETNCIYGRYEPRESGYFRWTAQWPTREWHCGYPVLEGAEVIELTDGKYGDFNGHNHTQLIDDHLFISHNNHSYHVENSSGQRCLVWIYKLGDPWKRSSFNKHQQGEPIDLFPACAPMNKDKFMESARFFGCPSICKRADGRLMAVAGVFTIRRGTKIDPQGKVNTWVHVCTLVRTLDVHGKMGPVKLIRINDPDAHRKAVEAGFLNFPKATESDWKKEAEPVVCGIPGRGVVADDGRQVTEFRDYIWLDKEKRNAVFMGRGENTYRAFRGYTALSNDGGKTWQKPQPTNIPNGENTITLVRLPDGRPAILGTFGDRNRFDRRPLCIAIANDGRNFSHVYRLSESCEKHQMVSVVFDEKYMIVAGPHRSNGNMGRGEHFVLRVPWKIY